MTKKQFDVSAEMYLDDLFTRYFDAWQKDINTKIIEDLVFVNKYKGEIARSFEEVKEQRNTLIGCMQDIIKTQDELKWLVLDLIKVITGNYPESRGRIEAEEYK